VAVNSNGPNGLFYGNPGQFVPQLIAVALSWIWSAVVTFILLKLIDAVIGLRVPPEHELAGLDASIHGEAAYRVGI
jgi:Amt family ammonium transporter